jgi:hypothetical protein
VCQKGSKIDQARWNYSRVCSCSSSRSGQYAESDEGDHLGRNSSGSRIPRCISRRIVRCATGSIELLPRTPPIYRRPYIMPVNDLVELKK